MFDPEANGLIGGCKDPESVTPAFRRVPVLARGSAAMLPIAAKSDCAAQRTFPGPLSRWFSDSDAAHVVL